MSLEGQQLGEFEILERLGQGGMGAVYKARQKSLRRMVALKTLQASLAEDPEYIARFEQEAVAAAGLMHPNLVQVFSAGENDGLHWFAMEYVEGESAKVRLKRKGRIDPLEAIAITIHVATALEYGWRKAALIHRDIKPDNIFLSSDGEVKLGDLGLAKSAGQTQGLTVTGHSMGTPHYISPEQVESTKDVDLRADIYSLGCTLYHMLSGQVPFDGNSAVSIMMKHVTAPVPVLKDAWPECPLVLNEVVGKMMKKNPADRQQDYAEVIGELRQAYEMVANQDAPTMVVPEPVPQPKATPLPTPAPKPRAVAAKVQPPTATKSQLPLYAAIAAVVGAIVIVCFFVFKPKEPQLTEAQRWAQDHAGDKRPANSPETAAKDAPFVNSLGMKFVPVPILSGPTAGQKVLFGVWDVRVVDYAVYAAANPKVDGAWKTQQKDGVPAGHELNHPVVGVSWEDAQGFCQWLTAKEQTEGRLPKGFSYRLPTDEEWSWAVALPPEVGTTPAEKNAKKSVDFPWGKDCPPKQKVGNYGDESFHAKFPSKKRPDGGTDNGWIEGYDDGYATTSPVGSFPANAYGLYDMGGNVWQWCEDWFDPSHKDRVLRGASWSNHDRSLLLSSTRIHNVPGYRNHDLGFRCVLAPTSDPGPTVASGETRPSPASAANQAATPETDPSTATKDAPFVNSLGMKFVPVPIPSGPTAGQRVLFSVWNVRVVDYAVYAAANPKVDGAWKTQKRDDVPAGHELNHPVVGVNWDDAQGFCQWLTAKEQTEGRLPKGFSYRLPTDEEWSWDVPGHRNVNHGFRCVLGGSAR